MQATRFERKVLTSFFVAGWLAFFSAAIAHAQLHGRPPPQPKPNLQPIDSIHRASTASGPRFTGTAKETLIAVK